MSKLVRIRPEALTANNDKATVANHGYLWLLDEKKARPHSTDPLKFYRSIATGERHPWYDSEVEGAD